MMVMAETKAAKGRGKTRAQSHTIAAAKQDANKAAKTEAPPRLPPSPARDAPGKYIGQDTSGKLTQWLKLCAIWKNDMCDACLKTDSYALPHLAHLPVEVASLTGGNRCHTSRSWIRSLTNVLLIKKPQDILSIKIKYAILQATLGCLLLT